MVWRLGLIVILCLGLVACGGGGNSSSSALAGSGTSSAVPPTQANGSAVATPVDVSAGQAIGGVNVVVSQTSSAPNIEDLGTNSVSGRGTATNTGSTIHRGSTMRVLLFGPGLNGDMKVIIAGPADISVANINGVQATDNTPGVAFNATATSDAALGARTVYLQNPNGDMTSFAGGLEVVP